MDWFLIAVGWTDPLTWVAALEVAVGLGFIIFVHELGHFAVAKICGVKVEKFMVGFDIAGLKLFSFRRGETLYGIGILPLGGYVKMLGQEDNPAQLRKEMERARQEGASGAAAAGGEAAIRAEPADVPSDNGVPAGEKALYDPRSYLAKSVPQRIAIISAGVIMNMIFALVFATVAYLVGVKQIPTVVGSVMSGGAAWQAGVEPDDRILEVAGRKVHNYRQMTEEIVNADLSHGVALLVQQPGVKEPVEIVVKPEQLLGAPRIGVGSSAELKIVKEKNVVPYLPDSAASNAKGPLLPGDLIEKINDKPIGSYGQLQNFLAVHAGEDLTVSVVRSKAGGEKPVMAEDTEKVQVVVPRTPMKHFGLLMEIGPIAALQAESPAAKAGLQAGDLLKTVDGRQIADPMKLPDEFHKRAGAEVSLGLERDGKPMQLKVKLSSPPRYAPSSMPDSPVAISELGAAYNVLNTVAHVEPSSPAAQVGLQAGDRITKAKIIPPSKEQLAELRSKYNDESIGQNEVTHSFAEKERNWPFFVWDLQGGLPGTTVEFTWKHGEEEKTAKMAPVAATDWFNSQPGWLLEPQSFVQKADTFSDAVRLGGRETVDAALAVYRMLHSVVGTQQISARNFSGPLGIFWVALMFAHQGLAAFLIFLTLISANLAVINFLPIPVLDGGHIVLLLYEGIRGKPADERVQEILTWIGLIFILGLMIFVFGLDFGLISRPGAH